MHAEAHPFHNVPLFGTHHSVPLSNVPLHTATMLFTIGVVTNTGLPQSPQKCRKRGLPESVSLSSNVLGLPDVNENVYKKKALSVYRLHGPESKIEKEKQKDVERVSLYLFGENT